MPFRKAYPNRKDKWTGPPRALRRVSVKNLTEEQMAAEKVAIPYDNLRDLQTVLENIMGRNRRLKVIRASVGEDTRDTVGDDIVTTLENLLVKVKAKGGEKEKGVVEGGLAGGTIAVGVIKSVEKSSGGPGKVTKAAHKGGKK